MRLYLAVAVLMLAFVAYTEAQDETIEEKLNAFGQQFREMGRTLADKAKATFAEFDSSTFAADTKNWFTNMYEKMKTQFEGDTQ